jgi:Rrf2 family protein
MGLRLTRAADYAVRAMIHIGSLPKNSVALKDDIAEAQHIPPSFMAKILRQLVKTGLLRSARGVHGGFGLARAADAINLLQIVEGIEGPIRLNDSKGSPDGPLSTVWLEAQNQMIALLRRTTLEALLATPASSARFACS